MVNKYCKLLAKVVQSQALKLSTLTWINMAGRHVLKCNHYCAAPIEIIVCVPENTTSLVWLISWLPRNLETIVRMFQNFFSILRSKKSKSLFLSLNRPQYFAQNIEWYKMKDYASWDLYDIYWYPYFQYRGGGDPPLIAD